MIKILIADDERFPLIALEKMIKNFMISDVMVITASEGRDAIKKAEDFRPEIAILDIEMPILSGIEVARMIKKENPKCKILFLTAYNKFEYAVNAIRIPAEDYLLKPVKEIDLEEKLLELCGKEGDKDFATEEEKTNFRTRIETYIELNFSKDISLEEIADVVNQSVYYFSRNFKQEFGDTFVDYLTKYRLNKAAVLLEKSDFSIKEITSICGYSDPNYFSKVFRKHMEKTPSAYRKKYRRQE